jgi:hypothetical protein
VRPIPGGLCDSCGHQQLVHTTRGSTFSLCLRHRAEPERFAKYPPLPVTSCQGYEPRQVTRSGSTSTR